MKTKNKNLIKGYESLSLTAYLDSVGVPTIGWGHTKTAKIGMTIDGKGAEALLESDLSWAENAVNKLVKVELNQNQFDALVSFTFNVGEANFSKSTLLRFLNAGDYLSTANEFKRWIFAGGKKLKGLEKRRCAEANQFISAPFSSRP